MNKSDKSNEQSLIKACVNGDSKAFKTLYDQHVDTMYAICLRYMSNSDEAKDALQEGFIRVFKNLGSFKFTGSFEGWLKRIFVNISIEQIRKRKLHSDVEDYRQDANLVTFQKTGTIDAEEMMKVVALLPTGYRTVFNMYVVDGYSHKEIAEHLGITESTSKSQLFKARKQLQNLLKDWFK